MDSSTLINTPIVINRHNRTDEQFWNEVKAQCRYLSDWGRYILSTGLNSYVQSIVLENSYICKDHRNLHSHFYSKKFNPNSAICSRLHFFNKDVPDSIHMNLNPTEYNSHYIGYSVIRDIKERCLGRTVIDPRKIGRDISDYFLLRTKFISHIGGIQFEVGGYPYMSQDTDATVCAHSALWGVCRFLSERYSKYAELYPFDLIELTGMEHGRTYPFRGMIYSDYATILSKFGCYPILVFAKDKIDDPVINEGAFFTLCSYVESGFPTLASFRGHVISIIGHTLDYEKVPAGSSECFIDSSKILKNFVVVDDNRFPYKLLGHDKTADPYYNYEINDIKTFVCPLPEKVFLNPEMAKKKALKVLELQKKRLNDVGAGPYITRLFLTSSIAFKKCKVKYAKNSGKMDLLCYLPAELRLPHFIWVMEVTNKEFGKQGQAMGEVIIDATSGQKEHGIIYSRIGNFFTLESHDKVSEDTAKTFNQYTHNLGERPYD